MGKTAITREETTTSVIPRLSMVDESAMEWLTDELQHDLKAGLEIVTKVDSGDEITSWNNWIVEVVKVVPELKEHLTVRQTKKRVKYYGVDAKIYKVLRDGVASMDGLPSL